MSLTIQQKDAIAHNGGNLQLIACCSRPSIWNVNLSRLCSSGAALVSTEKA